MQAALETPKEPDEVEVWPDMVPAVSLFFGMRTQWRWVGAGMAGAFRTGLDYSALAAVAGMLGIEVGADTLSDLATLEASAVEQWSRR